MSHLIGTYHCKADPKGRVKIPRALTKQLAGARQETFVIKRAVFQPCLELYSLKEWDALMAKLNKLNRFNKKNNDFIRRFTAGVKIVELDATDRLLIQRDLAKFAGVDKAVVLTAAVNIIEIWDKDRYEKAIDQAAVDFAALAEEVMGDDQENVS